MIEMKDLTIHDITRDMLLNFNHHQNNNKKVDNFGIYDYRVDGIS